MRAAPMIARVAPLLNHPLQRCSFIARKNPKKDIGTPTPPKGADSSANYPTQAIMGMRRILNIACDKILVKVSSSEK